MTMKHKYNIAGILTGITGYRGIPFPAAFAGRRPEGGGHAEDYEIDTEAPVRKEYVKCTRLYAQGKSGRWYFMPVYIKHKDIPADGNTYELQQAVISVTCKKNIVETQMAGRKGSVKELISIDDYRISIAAFIQSENGTYPEEEVTLLKEIFNINEPVELISAFTDLVFDDGDKIVITDISFPPLPGVEDAVAVKIECMTDRPFKLTM